MLRVAVVLSVIWIVAFGGYTWFSNVRQLDELYRQDMRTCSKEFDITENQTNYEYCIGEATDLYHSRFDVYKERIPRLLALDFGVVAFGWSLALLVICVIRLIRRISG